MKPTHNGTYNKLAGSVLRMTVLWFKKISFYASSFVLKDPLFAKRQTVMANLKMTRLLILIVFGLLISGCINQTVNTVEPVPEQFRPDWKGIDIDKLPVKFGQILKFEKDSNIIVAIVLDFNKDEGGIWIGLCLINNNKLFGRQIPSGFVNTKCLDLLDLAYLNIKGLEDYQITNDLTIDKNKVGIGSRSPVLDLDGLKRTFDFGVEQRKKEQVPYNKGLTDLNPVRECYFELEKIKN